MKTIVLTFLAATAIWASPVTIHMIDTGAGLSDGTFYVGPYDITINGSAAKALCYDIYDESSVGDVWTAQSLTLPTVMGGGGQFSPQSSSSFKYQEVAYLASLAPTAITSTAQIDLQHALWSLFAPTAIPMTVGMQGWLNNAVTNAASYVSSHPGQVTFYEAPYRQAVVVVSPEPSAIWLGLIGVGLLLVGRFVMKMCKVAGSSDRRISELQR